MERSAPVIPSVVAALVVLAVLAATASATVVRSRGECGTDAGCEVVVRPPGTWGPLQRAAGPALRLPYPRRTAGLRLIEAAYSSSPAEADDQGENVCAGYEGVTAVYRGGGARVDYEWYLARNGDCGDLGPAGAGGVRSVRLGAFRAELWTGPGRARHLLWGQDGFTGHILGFRGITVEQALVVARSVR